MVRLKAPERGVSFLSYFKPSMALVALGAATLAAVPAAAQDKEPWRYRVSAGVQVKPQYPGGDDLSVLPMFDVDRARGDTPFEFEPADDSFGFSVLKAGGFEFGPAVSLVGRRKPKYVGADVPRVGRTVEVGAFANYWVNENFRLHSELRRGVNGHDGWVADGGADLVLRDGDDWLFSIGPRVKWADGNFHDAYFGDHPGDRAGHGPAGLRRRRAGSNPTARPPAPISRVTPPLGRLALREIRPADRRCGEFAARAPLRLARTSSPAGSR